MSLRFVHIFIQMTHLIVIKIIILVTLTISGGYMSAIQDQLNQVRELVQHKRYKQARAMLKQLNHPKTEEWLRQIDAKEKRDASASTTIGAKSKPVTPRMSEPNTSIVGIITFSRVIVGSILALIIVVFAMVWIDQQFSIHKYFLDDTNRRIFLFTTGFAFLSTGVFGFIARLIGGASHFLIGVYYALLSLILLAAWHYLSVYNIGNVGGRLGDALSQTAMTAYQAFLNSVPLETMLAYGVAVLFSLGAAYFLGATSDEELERRARR